MSESRRTSILRVAGIVTALGTAGGLLGGLLVAGLVAMIVTANGGWRDFTVTALGRLALISAGLGAAYGIVLGPLLSWTMMRRVPLGRAIGETALLAAGGVAIAFLAPMASTLSFFGLPVLCAVGGAVRLRFAYRAPRPPALTE